MSYETICKTGGDFVVVPGEWEFKYDKDALTPSILREIRPLRRRYKAMSKNLKYGKKLRNQYKSRSDALKAIANAVYGLYGYAGKSKSATGLASRLYNPGVAGAITFVGRTLLNEGLPAIVEEIDYEIVYGDTDSIFIQLKGVENEIEFLRSKLVEGLNKFLKDRFNLTKSDIRLDYETTFVDLVMFTKKRYKGKDKDGNIIVKGIEVKRRDQSELTVEAQDTVTDMMIEHKTKDEIKTYVKDLIKRTREAPLEFIAQAKQATELKPKAFTQTLQAAYYAENYGITIDPLRRFFLIQVDRKKIPEKYPQTVSGNVMVRKKDDKGKTISWEEETVTRKVKVIGFEKEEDIPEDIKVSIDYDAIIDKNIKKKVEESLEILGLSWKDDIIG